MKKVMILSAALVLVLACKEDIKDKTEDFRDKTKETINKSGKAVEKTANKVVDEISSHINRNMGCEVVLSEELKNKGLNTGKFYIENDSITDKDNKLVIYLINEKAFKGDVTFKVTDKEGVESGRTVIKLNNKAGDAGYQDVMFDKRTDIESKSTISIY
jgi:hypothetical protein